MWDKPLVKPPAKTKVVPKKAKPKAKPKARAKPTGSVTKEINALKSITKKQAEQIDQLTTLVKQLVDQK